MLGHRAGFKYSPHIPDEYTVAQIFTSKGFDSLCELRTSPGSCCWSRYQSIMHKRLHHTLSECYVIINDTTREMVCLPNHLSLSYLVNNSTSYCMVGVVYHRIIIFRWNHLEQKFLKIYQQPKCVWKECRVIVSLLAGSNSPTKHRPLVTD